MLTAIQLHDQTGLNTGEIDNKSTDRMLPAELGVPNPTIPQMPPQLALYVS